jgi:uncharacterized protein
LFDAYGMESRRGFVQDDEPLVSAMTALEAGSVDAVVQVISIPADEIRSAAAAMPLRLLPIDEAVLARLIGEDGALLRGTIPKGTYPGTDADITTVAVRSRCRRCS